MALSDEQFCRELQTASGWQLGRITQAGKYSAYPLSLTTASKATTHRIVLVGNAAQTSHPIAGQGFNPGLHDITGPAETLTQAQDGVRDIGDYAVLACYQQYREHDRETTIGVTNSLVYLFVNHWALLTVEHNAGLMAMELFTPARDTLVERILGWVAW